MFPGFLDFLKVVFGLYGQRDNGRLLTFYIGFLNVSLRHARSASTKRTYCPGRAFEKRTLVHPLYLQVGLSEFLPEEFLPEEFLPEEFLSEEFLWEEFPA